MVEMKYIGIRYLLLYTYSSVNAVLVSSKNYEFWPKNRINRVITHVNEGIGPNQKTMLMENHDGGELLQYGY